MLDPLKNASNDILNLHFEWFGMSGPGGRVSDRLFLIHFHEYLCKSTVPSAFRAVIGLAVLVVSRAFVAKSVDPSAFRAECVVAVLSLIHI